MKRAMIVLAVMALCGSVSGDTNIWGDSPGNHQFSAVAGSNSAVVGWTWEPVEDFRWGFSVSPMLSGAADQKGSRWDTAMIGIGIEFPAVNFESLFDELPIEGEAFLTIDWKVDPKDDFESYLPIGIGADIPISKTDEHELVFRFLKPLTDINRGDSLVRDFMIGVAVRW